MRREVKIFRTANELAEASAMDFINLIKEAHVGGKQLTVALSGGNTPKLFFSILAEKYSESVDWGYVHFFWGDERCVPPVDPESNYGTFRDIFLKKITFPGGNIHRIRGEDNPVEEALRYSDEIRTFTDSKNLFPAFEVMILGLGEDGHTASIFPGSLRLLSSEKVCDVAVHPVSGQKRITVTGKVINNSVKVIFLVAGEKKAVVIADIFNEKPAAMQSPASYILPVSGNSIWMVDEKAAKLIK
jgi:6-phosphogluconolactonase